MLLLSAGFEGHNAKLSGRVERKARNVRNRRYAESSAGWGCPLERLVMCWTNRPTHVQYPVHVKEPPMDAISYTTARANLAATMLEPTSPPP
jgi:hypothetical protein